MQLSEIPVRGLGLFSEDNSHFWMDNLAGLLQRFPQLEYPHRQDFFMLLFIDDAQGEISIDNQKVRLDSPKVIVIKPRRISSIDINRKAKGKIICFTEDFFSLPYSNSIVDQFDFLNDASKVFVRISEEEKNKWIYLLEIFLKEFKLHKRESMKVLGSYLNILLFDLDRLYDPSGFAVSSSLKHNKIKEFEKLIDKDFKMKKMPSAYADLLNVTPNYLNKICKEVTNYTAGDLIRRRIVIEAQRLIHFTNYSINEIADQLGFENASYFVTFFKRQTSKTPEQFRRLSNQ